jgi:hypothetical protein
MKVFIKFLLVLENYPCSFYRFGQLAGLVMNCLKRTGEISLRQNLFHLQPTSHHILYYSPAHPISTHLGMTLIISFHVKIKTPCQFHIRFQQHLRIFLRIWYLLAKALSGSHTSELLPHRSFGELSKLHIDETVHNITFLFNL